jgi:translin
MKSMRESLPETVDGLRAQAQAMHDAREEALVRCRKLGQLAAKSIRHVHRRQFDEAEKLLTEAKEQAVAARDILSRQPQLNPAYLHDTEKEMVEAASVLAIVGNRSLPTAAELGASTMSYLNGLGEAASEVRRFVLDEMRAGNVKEAERIFADMEAIYEELMTFDFADSLTQGLRRTCDSLRPVIERTRTDLTASAIQLELIRELQSASLTRQSQE